MMKLTSMKVVWIHFLAAMKNLASYAGTVLWLFLELNISHVHTHIYIVS